MPSLGFDDNALRSILVQLSVQPADVVENEKLEVKGWCKDEKQLAEKVVDAASCFANAGGGIIIVGVSPEEKTSAKFSRCPYRDVNPGWLLARVQDSTHPPVECEVRDITALLSEVSRNSDVNAYALHVPRTRYPGGHITTKGISKIRVGKECRPNFTAQDDRTRTAVYALSVEDLSPGTIAWAIEQHQKKFKYAENWPERWDFLVRARLLEPFLVDGEWKPRFKVPLATLILFGSEAALLRHMPYFETVVKTPTGHRRLRKNIVDSVRELALGGRSVLQTHCPDVPEVTLQELLVNAYIHRCWRTPAPVVITISPSSIEVQNPGGLLPGLHVENLIYCVPAYRNLLLAEGARFIGLCDKIGQGIDLVFRSVLSGGFDFPVFESEDNLFTAHIGFQRSEQFSEFVRRRGGSLPNLDDIIALRVLWQEHEASLAELACALQRSPDVTRRVLASMRAKLMVEPIDAAGVTYRLTSTIQSDIQTIFQSDQLDLFGG